MMGKPDGAEPSRDERRWSIRNTVLTVVVLTALVVPLVMCVLPLLLPKPQPQLASTATVGPSAIPTVRPTRRPTATPLPTPTRVPTPAGLPAAPSLEDTWVRPKDGMVMLYVPPGTFTMGTAADDPAVQGDEVPPHPVTLSGFWIDRTEVSNAQYARCVAAGSCMEPFPSSLRTFQDYYGNPRYDDFPVVYVSWVQARDYCAWAGGQLPSEAQWEYAARGPDGLIYPWGDDPPDEDVSGYGQSQDYASAVGSYPRGASWCGALDMAGNVWEWTADWYGPYGAQPQIDPTGPAEGPAHVARGGSWYDGADFLRSANRYALNEPRRDYYGPAGHGFNVGFRCVVLP